MRRKYKKDFLKRKEATSDPFKIYSIMEYRLY